MTHSTSLDVLDEWRRAAAGAQDHSTYTYSIDRARDLGATDRDAARAWLVERVEATDDVRAVETLAALGWVEAAPTLRALAARARPSLRAAIERALLRLEPDPSVVADIEAQLASPMSIDAAFALSRTKHPSAFEPLLGALYHDDPTVRFHAFEGLARMTGLDGLYEPRQGPFAVLKLRLNTELPAVYRAAASECEALFRRARVGEEPDALGLVYAPGPPEAVEQFVAALPLDAYPEAIPPSVLHSLSGHDRAWAEAVLTARLGRMRDHRIAALVAALPAGNSLIREVLARDERAGRDDAFTRSLRDALA